MVVCSRESFIRKDYRSYLHLVADCFMKISLQSLDHWREIFMKQSVIIVLDLL